MLYSSLMNVKAIDAQPNPEFLIKSISEQGYSLETALADLIDNSISAKANKIEILTEHSSNYTSIFITDNGLGMTKDQLSVNMQFPSRDMESDRDVDDLGRFGLGLKTASFSQTRKFTVISRKKGSVEFSAMTWDVAHLKKTGLWEIIVNTSEEISALLNRHTIISESHLEKLKDYQPNTIILWEGLKNFDNYIDLDRSHKHINEELTSTVSEYLSVVFHEFMESESNPLKIRLNNTSVSPFNPFKSRLGAPARALEPREMRLGNDILKMQGYVLPVTASDNSNIWTTTNKSLLDMEGIYIYRGNRIIFFGGWNGIIRKQAKLKLARLKIQVRNMNDEKLQLNVSKSKIAIPYELKRGVLRYISELKTGALNEYNNRGLKSSSNSHLNIENNLDLLQKQSTTKGPVYSINPKHPLVKIILEDLSDDTTKDFKALIRSINLMLNRQRYTDSSYVEILDDKRTLEDILSTTKRLLDTGISKDDIYDVFLRDNGYQKGSLPKEIKDILKNN
jgi:hypothetical protein